MKRLLANISFLLLALPLLAQQHELAIGLRSGAQVPIAAGSLGGRIMPEGFLDAQYSYTTLVGDRTMAVGFTTGLAVGYSIETLKADPAIKYSTFDAEGDQWDYTISGSDIVSRRQGLNAQIPLFFSLRSETGGFMADIGMKIALPYLLGTIRQDVDHIDISAVVPYVGTIVTNELITGRATEQAMHRTAPNPMSVSLMLALQMGYRWRLKSSASRYAMADFLSLSAYADLDVYHSRSSSVDEPSYLPFYSPVQVSQIGDPASPLYPCPTVSIPLLANQHYLSASFGLRLTCTMAWMARPPYGLHTRRHGRVRIHGYHK